MNITEIDKNLEIRSDYDTKNITFYDVRQEPFQIYGAANTQDGSFVRLPLPFAERISDDIAILAANTAGVRIRFTTDAKTIVLRVFTTTPGIMPHMTLCGQAGFDMYEDFDGKSEYLSSFFPPANFENGYIAVTELPEGRMRSLTINFPLYHSVTALEIGVEKTAHLAAGRPYLQGNPILYYGSSITQGACASRPGNAYASIIARRLNRDYINLGFSGGAKGEPEMAQYIAQQKMSAFVCDYDHNAPDVQHLEQTHYTFYATVRKEQPDIPIILISRPNFSPTNSDDVSRRNVIQATFQRGKQEGDQNLWFLDGETLFDADNRDCSTVDTCHPNDFGFVFMARRIGDILEQCFKR